MKPYMYSHKYCNVIELKPKQTSSNKKATRQRAKRDIKKESIFENSCPHCGSIDVFHFHTKNYSYCNDCEFEYPLWY